MDQDLFTGEFESVDTTVEAEPAVELEAEPAVSDPMSDSRFADELFSVLENAFPGPSADAAAGRRGGRAQRRRSDRGEPALQGLLGGGAGGGDRRPQPPHVRSRQGHPARRRARQQPLHAHVGEGEGVREEGRQAGPDRGAGGRRVLRRDVDPHRQAAHGDHRGQRSSASCWSWTGRRSTRSPRPIPTSGTSSRSSRTSGWRRRARDAATAPAARDGHDRVADGRAGLEGAASVVAGAPRGEAAPRAPSRRPPPAAARSRSRGCACRA